MRLPLLKAVSVLSARALGAQSDSSRPAQPLPAVSVSAEKPVIAEFEERRVAGFGHFITRKHLEQRENSRTADVLMRIPGLKMVRGGSGRSYVATTRVSNGRRSCYSNVYLDGAIVYTSGRGEPFDVNQIGPNQIEAIEYYSSAAQIPARFNRTDAACGVLVIWTRRSADKR